MTPHPDHPATAAYDAHRAALHAHPKPGLSRGSLLSLFVIFLVLLALLSSLAGLTSCRTSLSASDAPRERATPTVTTR